jgi:hypothetical protein
MEFTAGQLGLIYKSLMFYSEHPEYLPEHKLDDARNAEKLAIEIYVEYFKL